MVNRKELRPESSPRAAYGAHLRRLREERCWTQEDLAGPMGCTSQHISAVETGRKPPTLPFSRRADQVFGLAGTSESLEREWRDMRHGVLLEGFPEYVGYEGRAVEIRLYEIGIIPGLLQTPEYARVLANSAVKRGAITPEQADERVAFLAARQAALEQEHLPVNLLTLTDRSVVCYAESQTQGHLDREITSVVPMLTAYHQLQAASLSQAESVAVIQEARKGSS